MPLTLAALKTELQTDPATLGYAGKSDEACADILNVQRAGVNVFRGVLQAHEVTAATDATEWAALSAQEKQRYQTIISAGQIDASSPNIRAAFNAMFGAGSATRANLTAMVSRTGSRAESLFGVGAVVTPSNIADAKRS